MAIFTDKIVTASFLDYPQNTLVEVIYNEGDQNIAYTLEVDFTQDDFKALLQEVTLEEIEKATKQVIRTEAAFFKNIINDEVKRKWVEEKENLEAKPLTASEFLSVLFNKNEDKDFVFNMKIAILELPEINKSKDKKLKLDIRKAKTTSELMKAYLNSKD